MSGSLPQGGNDTTYVCANFSVVGGVLFVPALLDNDELTITPVSYTFLSEGMVRMYLFICMTMYQSESTVFIITYIYDYDQMILSCV